MLIQVTSAVQDTFSLIFFFKTRVCLSSVDNIPKEAQRAYRKGPEKGNKYGTGMKTAELQGKVRDFKFVYLGREKSEG